MSHRAAGIFCLFLLAAGCSKQAAKAEVEAALKTAEPLSVQLAAAVFPNRRVHNLSGVDEAKRTFRLASPSRRRQPAL